MPRHPVYVTTAIAYVNADPHLGFAMECVEADCIARYHRLIDDDTYFLTGTDEHGTKQKRTAEKLGMTPQELCDKNVVKFQALKKILNLTNDDFIRTTDQKRHWPAVVKLWKKLVDSGDIYKAKYAGLYCSGCEGYVTEKDLVDGHCPNHKNPPEEIVEENYFFKLSKYSDTIGKLIETKKLEIIPEFRAKEILNLIKEGLTDVSFSRPKSSLDWGVPVPDDDDQVMYVWCDALTNYISAIGYTDEGELYKKYWPHVIHVIGKDIVRFHAAIWPAMLISAGIEPPEKIFVHGFISSQGQKMSKTLGNVVDPKEMVEKYGADALRYYLLSEIPVGKDGDFSIALFEERYNAHLANSLGNLVNRVLLMTDKYFDGKIPEKTDSFPPWDKVWKDYEKSMNAYYIHDGIAHVWDYIKTLNTYIEVEKPWKLAKNDDKEKLAEVMYNLLESLRQISLLIWPIIPECAEKLRKQLGLGERKQFLIERDWGGRGDWKKIGKAEILFPKLEL